MTAPTRASDGRNAEASSPARIRRPERWQRLGVGASSVTAALVLWELYARSLDSNLFIPTVLSVLGALVDLVQDAEFWRAYGQTLVPFAWGLSTALAAGIPFGLMMGRSRVLRELSTPYLAFLNALPISTLVPVVVITFGIGLVARSAVVFLFAIVDVVLTTAAGVKYITPDLMEMSDSFGAGRRTRVRRVIVPGAMPGILAALRVGSGRAVVGMVVMELLLVAVGVGRLISRYRDGFKSPELYAVVVSLAAFGLLVMAMVRIIEKRATKWKPE